LRAIEEMLLKGATHNLIVRTRSETALYLLNHKRAHLRELEERFQLTITVNADATVAGQVSYVIEKGEQVHSIEQAKALMAVRPTSVAPIAEEEEEAAEEVGEIEEAPPEEEAGPAVEGEEAGEAAAEAGEGERGGRKRRRRRRGRRGGEGRETEAPAAETSAGLMAAPSEHAEEAAAEAEAEAEFAAPEVHEGEAPAEAERRRRRRGRRGGRRSRQGREGEALPPAQTGAYAEAGLYEPQPEEAIERAPSEGELAEREPAHAEAEVSERPAAEVAQEQPSAEPAPIAPVAPPVGAPAPRRGSTVREPAPTSFALGAFAPRAAPLPPVEPPPEPSAAAAPSEDMSRPRRAGWWSKRLLGKE